MPGLFGYTKSKYFGDINIVSEMKQLATHYSFHVADACFNDKNIVAARIHTNIIQKEKQPHVGAGVYIWLDGEFYNQSILTKSLEDTNDVALLLQLYLNDKSFRFLKKIDGAFTAVIYDSGTEKLHLISDRHGLKQLFWTCYKDSFFWFSEIKAVLAIPGYPSIMDKTAIETFVEKEYLAQNTTWFKDIFLLDPATVLTWDFSSQNYTQQQYWCWGDVAPVFENVDEHEMLATLDSLFSAAVEKRVKNNERSGITLSGGLDSRALLAALPSAIDPVCVTFGKKQCDDIRIARMVVKQKNCRHLVYDLNSENWIKSCFKAVWITDGQMNLTDMHGVVFAPNYRQYFDVNLNGFLGDALLGGGFYHNKQSTLFNMYLNRGRRRIYMGVKYLDNFVHNRMPFMDNDLMDFIISHIHCIETKSGFIYHKMLLQQYPEYYKKIPWQTTGLPIGASAVRLFLERVKNKLGRELPFLSLLNKSKDYNDYPLWGSIEPARSIFINFLTNSNSLYQNYLDKNAVLSKLNKFLVKEDVSFQIVNYLSKILTIEIWLQQFHNNKYREGLNS